MATGTVKIFSRKTPDGNDISQETKLSGDSASSF